MQVILQADQRPKQKPQRRTSGEPMEFEWNIFTGFTTLQLVQEVQKFMNKIGDPDQFQGRINFMSMFNDIIWGIKDNEKECIANSTLVSLFAKGFPAGRWSFLGPGSETKWYSTYNERPQGEWDRVGELMMIKCGESGHPIFRATSPLSRGALKCKGGGKLSFHYCADGDTVELLLRTIVSVNQLSKMCEEYSSCQTRTGRPVLAEQSDPLFVSKSSLMKKPTPTTEAPYRTRNSIRSSLPRGKKNKHSSSTRRTTSRRRWSNRILETER